MPPSLPRHREAVVVSGLAEIAGGAAVLPPGPVACPLVAARPLLTVFPANIHMALNPEQVRGLDPEPRPGLATVTRLAASAAGDDLGLARHSRVT